MSILNILWNIHGGEFLQVRIVSVLVWGLSVDSNAAVLKVMTQTQAPWSEIVFRQHKEAAGSKDRSKTEGCCMAGVCPWPRPRSSPPLPHLRLSVPASPLPSSSRQSTIIPPPRSPMYGGFAVGLLSSTSAAAACGLMQINFTVLLFLSLQRKCSLADYQEKSLMADSLVCVRGGVAATKS